MPVKSIFRAAWPSDIGDSQGFMGHQSSKFDTIQWKNESQNLVRNTTNYAKNSNLSNGLNSVYCTKEEIISDSKSRAKSSPVINNPNYSFNNKNLDAVCLDVDSTAPPFLNGHWKCNIQEDANRQNRIKISEVKVQEIGMSSGHNVFDSIEFRDVVVEFKFSKDPSRILYKNLDEIAPSFIGRSAGILGTTSDDIVENSDDAPYQAGFAQSMSYFFGCGDIRFSVYPQFSFVFRYPMNDFEPGGVINACKVYPQIQFFGTSFNYKDYPAPPVSGYAFWTDIRPANISDEIANSIYIAGYKGRVKLVVDVNSKHYITPQIINGQTYNQNYFGNLRAADLDLIPPMFEKVFKQEYYGNNNTNNFLGLFTDSNDPKGLNENGGRLRPPYNSPFGIGNPFWFNVFDYAHYNVENSMEFVAVEGMQSTDTTKYADGKFIQRDFPTVAYPFDYGIHPSADPNATTLPMKYQGRKFERQGAFDNIHLHGYLGHYKDNDKLVVHAPVCAHCCFHMHWRWSALNVDVANNILLQRFKRFNNAASFKGWDKTNSNKKGGMPLIPYNQHLKIAATLPDHNPYNVYDTVLEPGVITPLLADKKAIWYCVDIVNVAGDGDTFEGAYNSHVILEQGCGYAFDYSSVANNILNNTLMIDPGPDIFIKEDYFKPILAELGYPWQQFYDEISPDTQGEMSIKVAERFEMQYRLMRFYNKAAFNPNQWNLSLLNSYPEDFTNNAYHFEGFQIGQNDDRTMNNVDQIPTFHSDPDLLNTLKNL